MNTTDIKPLPARPSLEQYRKQAKDLLKLGSLCDSRALTRIKNYHPGAARLIRSEALSAEFALADAQLIIAREHGFDSWPRFAKHLGDLNRNSSSVSKFELAADAIVSGDIGMLARLLAEMPKLVRTRSTRAHQATLLHYLGANGFENYRQKSPRNAVEVAKLLLNAGAEIDAVANVYSKSTTLGLVASSVHPKRAGVQIPLMEILLEYGAKLQADSGIVNPLLAALRNGHPEAAEFLARHGAPLGLEEAAGVGRLDVVQSFFDANASLKANATQMQLEAGFMWACEYGRTHVIDFLLRQGLDVRSEGNTGLTGLHWAVVGGNSESIKLLLDRGAPIDAVNKYGGTALGQALWSAMHGDPDIDYVPVVEMLLTAGAQIEDGSLAWLARQEERSAASKTRIADLLRRHGAQ